MSGLVDREHVQQWLDAYIRAWETYDRDQIEALFSEDVSYHFDPFDDGLHGRGAVVESWFEDPDAPGTWSASYRPIAVDGDVAVANGRSKYEADPSRDLPAREYDNIFVIRFDSEGRCREFREWYYNRRWKEGGVS